jgi:prepilin-type N-terminal cleavage/methylation domain-containing protein
LKGGSTAVLFHAVAGTAANVRGERGFTLIETIVVAAILAMLATVAVISLGQRPGALSSALTGFDASLAAARAIAASSGNGATLVFAARTNGSTTLPGFALTVYRGRPTAANAVTVTTVMAVTSDVSVREGTLGSPTFAIFLSSAGHASGQAGYPAFTNGVATFAPIATQPACPPGGFVLSFSDAHATQTRTLSCRVSVASTPLPFASMAPSAILLTPTSLTYFWPAAPQQHFVATEWGYTRWFAASSWSCGSDIAAFPQTFPAPPYSPAYSLADQNAEPLAPVTLPYSFANSSQSMEDAPAWFYLAPQTAGVCSVTIGDANAQQATLAAHVMGWLTLGQGAKTATSQSGPLVLSGVTLQNVGDSVTISADKNDDDDSAGIFSGASNVTVSNNCLGYIIAGVGATSFAGSGDTATSNASLALTVSGSGNTASSAASCTAAVTDRYNEPVVTVEFTVQPNVPPVSSWPAELVLGAGQASVGTASGSASSVALDPFGPLLNAMLGGGIARAAGAPCYARGTTDGTTVDMSLPAWVSAQTGIYYDTNGCEVDANDNPLPASSVGMVTYTANQVSVTYNVNLGSTTCNGSQVSLTGWNPASAVGKGAILGAEGVSAGSCSVTLADGDNTQSFGRDSGTVAINVLAPPPCSQIGNACTFTAVPWPDSSPACIANGGGITPGDDGTGEYSLSSSLLRTGMEITNDAYGHLTNNSDGGVTFTRTALGTDTIYAFVNYDNWNYVNVRGILECKKSSQPQPDTSWTVP